MQHNIYFISDIELGRGDIFDDFSDDNTLIKFLEQITSKTQNEKTTLVLNGDIFDFLKMPYEGKFPKHITQDISVWKLNEVITHHPTIFSALKEFTQNSNHKIFFVIGNHDADVVWPAIQRKLIETLDSKGNIHFGYKFQNKELHAEHGHLVDTFFSFNKNKPIISYRGEQILNLPWGWRACASHLMDLKKRFPYEEQLNPKPLALKLYPEFAKESKKTVRDLTIKSIIRNPILRFWDPTHHAPYWKFFKHTLRHGFEYVDDEKFIVHMIKTVAKNNPTKQTIILGHMHIALESTENEQKIYVTDTWRNEYQILENYKKKTKTYVHAAYENDKLTSTSLHKLNNNKSNPLAISPHLP